MTDNLTICKATKRMLDKAKKENITTAFTRSRMIKPCPFGAAGTCCRVCAMGPCRVSERVPKGVCGANDATIAARNLARMIAAGTAAHTDHARIVAETFLAATKGELPGYGVKDERKLRDVAEIFGVKLEGKGTQEIAQEVAEIALQQFGQQQGELLFINRAPERRKEVWRRLGIVPRGIDREIAETMHRTSIGVDQDVTNILLQGFRTALADGWGGCMIATELQDIMLGSPVPKRSRANLGVLKEECVNIIVHGHEPLLSEMIIVASRSPELIRLAEEKGAKGINICGICCTANEVLVRHGIPLAGDYLQQELAIITGAVDVMVVDVQCIMQSLPEVANCYHTEVITTSPKAKMPGAIHIEFNKYKALDIAKEIVKRAIQNFTRRGENIDIPKEEVDLVAGFTYEYINYMLGGSFRASYRPLNDNIIDGRILGVVGMAGCNNPRVRHNEVHVEVARELIANNVLVVQTGCAALTCAKAGLMVPEAQELAGPGLREVCEAVGMPPVLHCGACVDNSRILIATTEMVKIGGLGDDISDLPVVAIAPEWMSEKAMAIGHFAVAHGLLVIFGVTYPVTGSVEVSKMVFEKYEELTGGKFVFEPDPNKIVAIAIDWINKKRKALGIDKKPERVLYDMAMRRELKF